VQSIEPGLDISASDWNKLCYYGNLLGYPNEVMDACDRAVELNPESAGIKESSGLARALKGDYPGEIKDISVYIEWLEKNSRSQYEIRMQKHWVAEWKSGQNPFNEATLMELR
jgi:hypothetical protein